MMCIENGECINREFVSENAVYNEYLVRIYK